MDDDNYYITQMDVAFGVGFKIIFFIVSKIIFKVGSVPTTGDYLKHPHLQTLPVKILYFLHGLRKYLFEII